VVKTNSARLWSSLSFGGFIVFFCQRLRGLALIMMTETSGLTASSLSISRDWFEDSSLEGEAPICFRLLKKGGKKKPTLLKTKMTRKVEQITLSTAARVPLKKKKKFVQNVKQMVEVRVVVKIALTDVVSSKVYWQLMLPRGLRAMVDKAEDNATKKGRGRLRIGVKTRFVPVYFNAPILVSFPVPLLWPEKFRLLQQVTPTTAVVLRVCLIVKCRRKER
jgi:hypothetical protein